MMMWVIINILVFIATLLYCAEIGIKATLIRLFLISVTFFVYVEPYGLQHYLSREIAIPIIVILIILEILALLLNKEAKKILNK